MKMLHHPFCSKSKAAFELIQEKGITVEIIDLTKVKLTREFISALVEKLGDEWSGLIRTSEPLYLKQFADKVLTKEELVEALMKFPALIQRPVYIQEEMALIGRPIERVFELMRH